MYKIFIEWYLLLYIIYEIFLIRWNFNIVELVISFLISGILGFKESGKIYIVVYIFCIGIKFLVINIYIKRK